ncbi:MAG: hypothetical protein GXO66_03080 [Euryarchaeota archaeon]|nr:hypothetical protein [Euryarchaeota archaeon]
MNAGLLLTLAAALLLASCAAPGGTPEVPPPAEEQEGAALYILLTMDAEEKDDLLAIHGGILDAMLDIFEEEGLEGKVELLLPVDDWKVAVEHNLSVVERINSYPISLHCDRHARFTFQDRERQRERISTSIAWLREHFNYSGLVFRAPTLMLGETTRDVLDEVGIWYDLTPQIYASPRGEPFFPVLVRQNLRLLPTSIIITGGFPDYPYWRSVLVNRRYLESFDHLYSRAREEGPLVGVVLLHPTNWNNESLQLLRQSLRYMKSKPGVRFITASELERVVPVLGRNPLSASPRIGVLVAPREDYSREKESFNDESFLLYVLRSYGLRAERAEPSKLEEYDRVVYYSPTGEQPPTGGNLVVLDRGRLAGITPEALMRPSGRAVAELRCRLLEELVDVEALAEVALREAHSLGATPYLDRAARAEGACERLKLAYLSTEYALQLGAAGRKAAKPEKYSLVEGRIPMIYYGRVDGVYLGYQPAPHGIAQAAREAFYAYARTGNRENLSRGLFLVDYLLSTAVDRGEYLIWEYPFPWPPYDLEEGWRGSLCQAGILKALMLAYMHTGEERYRQASEKVLRAFSVPVEEGGLLKLREGYCWYPEYVREPPPYVLNGFITTLIWLREYADYFNSSEAEERYSCGVEALRRFLPEYDAEGWSYYDAWGKLASEHYHRMHLWQLEVMYNLTGDELFLKYRSRWLRSE